MSIQIEATGLLTKEDVAPLLKKSYLGPIRYLKPISKGIESSSYSVITENQTFVLTLFNNNFDNLSNLKEITNHFHSKGFPFSSILATGVIANKPGFLSPHLHGKVKSNWDEKEFKEIGFFLGNFHKCSYYYKPNIKTIPFIWQFSDIFYQIKKHIPAEFLRLEQEIFFIEEEWPSDLPKGIIHGDIWPRNILFMESTITGVLDFKPTYDPYILDLANILKGISKEQNNLKEALISGYEVARPLAANELSSLDLMIYAKIVSSILYFLEKAILHPKKRNEFQTYALLNLLKLDSYT